MDNATTLADALLDDLDDLNDSDEEELAPPANVSSSNSSGQRSGPSETLSGLEDSKPAAVPSSSMISSGVPLISRIFVESRSLQKHLERLRKRVSEKALTSAPTDSKGLQEEDHQLVVQSNKHLALLVEELGRAHGLLAAAYKPRFPELEELLPNYEQYKNTVRVIGNHMDLTKVSDELMEIGLSSNQVITISVSGSTTTGRSLTETELAQVEDAAKYMDELHKIQKELVGFVEQSMEALAPSICALIGPSTAAKLLGLAGGLAEVTKIPACNLQVMGQVKQNAASRAGLSTSNTQQHVGILAECDLIRNTPKHMQKKALKVVASKLALAARFDFVNVDSGRPRSASTGLQFRHDIEQKFERLQEPDKAPVLKALPKPDLSVKKRRGGKRMRKWKERFEETALMKQANTRAFSSAHGEYGDDAMGITMGLLDTADGGGNIRKTTEKRKMRQANTKASRKRTAQLAEQAKNKDGLASSVVFSQSTSMELVNPDANKDRVREANRKWFKDNAGFQSALPRKS